MSKSKSDNDGGITISDCIVARVSTLADGSLRATFDLPENSVPFAAWLMMAKQDGSILELSIRELT